MRRKIRQLRRDHRPVPLVKVATPKVTAGGESSVPPAEHTLGKRGAKANGALGGKHIAETPFRESETKESLRTCERGQTHDKNRRPGRRWRSNALQPQSPHSAIAGATGTTVDIAAAPTNVNARKQVVSMRVIAVILGRSKTRRPRKYLPIVAR